MAQPTRAQKVITWLAHLPPQSAEQMCEFLGMQRSRRGILPAAVIKICHALQADPRFCLAPCAVAPYPRNADRGIGLSQRYLQAISHRYYAKPVMSELVTWLNSPRGEAHPELRAFLTTHADRAARVWAWSHIHDFIDNVYDDLIDENESNTSLSEDASDVLLTCQYSIMEFEPAYAEALTWHHLGRAYIVPARPRSSTTSLLRPNLAD